jgi:hypothetical protein
MERSLDARGKHGVSGTGTYVYGLVRTAKPPRVPRGLRGLPQTGPVRVLAADDRLWLVVADAPLARYSADAIERGLRDLDWVSACAAGHEGVVERFAGSEALAPMKLFTIFESDARAQAVIRRDRARLARTLDRVAGRQEWGVRVLLDERRALARARARSGASRPAGRGSGASFLAAKKRERDATRRLLAGARREMESVLTDLARYADDARQRGPTPSEAGSRLVLDAAFLLPARGATRFRAAVKRLARRLGREGYDVTLTGPWPAYSFVAETM